MAEHDHNHTKQRRSSKKAPAKTPTKARVLALEIGSTARKRNAFVSEIIPHLMEGKSLPQEERAFATKVALGVASTRGTLDEVMDRHLKKPESLEDDVRDALRISTYEILFLSKSPHAAVDQGVELVRSINPRASGLANAVLRKVAIDKASFPFGDPTVSAEALAREQAFPLWLTKELVSRFGHADARTFMAISNETAPLFIAVNAILSDDESVRRVFEHCGEALEMVNIARTEVPGCYRATSPRALLHDEIKKLFSRGHILVSDAASQMIAHLALPSALPEGFLEIGSGRATKTILLQANAQRCYHTQLTLTAVDNHAFKIKLLKDRAQHYGTSVEHACVGDATDLDSVIGSTMYGAAFIDAPCSGLGTLRRHPEIRWRLTPRDIDDLAALSCRLLRSAAGHIVVGGSLTFATCTVTARENEDVIHMFLETEEGSSFAIEPILGKESFATALTSGGTDAHFAVRMVRKK